MQNYELITILDAGLDNETTDQTVDKVVALIEAQGGKVAKTDKWGRKKLAYEIKHKTDGYYFLVNFQSGTEAIDEVRRVLSINDNVMRHRIVRLPDNKS